MQEFEIRKAEEIALEGYWISCPNKLEETNDLPHSGKRSIEGYSMPVLDDRSGANPKSQQSSIP